MPEKNYSFRSLIDKLNVKEGSRVLVLDVDDAALLTEIRSRTQSLSENRGQKACDVILPGVENVSDLRKIESCRALMALTGGLWVIYPKSRKDITEAQVRAAGLATGMVDNKPALVVRAGKTEDKACKGKAGG